MSEPDNQIPKAPTVKTSAVPLKKETVRITLRPSAPPSEPLAPVAPPPPTAQVPSAPAPVPMPPAPRVPSGAPTVPLRSAPPPVRPASPGGPPTVAVGSPPPRPSGPLAPPAPVRPVMGGAPPPPVGSKTIPLAQAPGPRPVTPAGRPTAALTGAPATQPLPKATMKLTRTEPMGNAGPPTGVVSSAPIKTAQFEDDDEEENEGALNGMSIVALVGSIAALFVSLLGFTSVKPFVQPDVARTDEKEWVAGGKTDWKIPAKYNPFSKENPADGSYSSRYKEIKEADHLLTPAPESK